MGEENRKMSHDEKYADEIGKTRFSEAFLRRLTHEEGDFVRIPAEKADEFLKEHYAKDR